MAERSMAVVLKTTEPETVPGVRIPLSPPAFAQPLASLAGYGWRASESCERSAKAVHQSRELSERRSSFPCRTLETADFVGDSVAGLYRRSGLKRRKLIR